MSDTEVSVQLDIDVEVSKILMRFDRISKVLINLKKKGRANYTTEILLEKLALVRTYWHDAFQRYDELCARFPEPERLQYPFFREDKFNIGEEQFLEAQTYLAAEMSKITASNKGIATSGPSSQEGPSSGSDPIMLDLPRQSLPKFGGELRKWFHFEDVFASTIIRNRRLSDVQRLQYLNACVEGEPLSMIESLDIVEQNFDVAWRTLKERYGKRQLVIENLLDSIFELKPIRRGELASIKQVTVYLRQTLNALGKLDRPVEMYSDVLIAYVKKLMDDELKREWRRIVVKTKEYPSFEVMLKFLEEYEDTHLQPPVTPRKAQLSDQSKPRVRAHNAVPDTSFAANRICGFCTGSHDIIQCRTLLNMTPEQRYSWIKNKRGCVRCLDVGHVIKFCPSRWTCKKCNGKHNSLLHFDVANPGAEKGRQDNKGKHRGVQRAKAPPRTNSGSTDGPSTSSSPVTSHAGVMGEAVARPVILATAWVQIFGKNGKSRKARALLDQGSESSFISASLVNDLQLSRRKTPAALSGLGGGRSTMITHSVQMIIGSTQDASKVYTTSAYVIPKITTYTPPSIRMLEYEQLSELTLADPDPASTHRIEVLIGADLYAQILRRGIRRTSANGPIAQATAFGWVISGPINSETASTRNVRALHCTALESLDETIRRFWEMEEIPSTVVHTKAEEECEAYFAKTVKRDETGRFIVRLPFNQSRPEEMLGDSLHIALSALTRLRKKLDVNPTLVQEYGEFLTEYESLTHMTRLKSVERTRLYIPHRAVIREESATTKLRVVFNASSGTTSGSSLNDVLHVGPKLQNDITSVITRWRLYGYVLVADIEKMFRQILIAPEDRRFQCIVWREPETEQIAAFELNTVTYGTACAPYLSMRTLLELKSQDGDDFPLAAPILEKDTYVDDVFLGAPDKSLLEKKRKQVCGLLQRGGFHLRKWAGNSPDLLRNIPQSSHSHAVDLTLFEDSELKVLGLRWIPSGDYFYFNLQRFQPSEAPITKRKLFSEIAKLYDPLGWLSPIVIRAKILMQSQWLEKIQWDDQVSANTHETWNTFCADWSRLNKLKIPRWIRYSEETVSVELHGFCDASLAAYSAVTYLRVIARNNEVFTSLLMAKTRVAPIKTVSIPILELNGAVLLTELLQHVKSSLSIRVERVVCWSDSTITLAWLRKHPSTWKVVVANRVSKIQTQLPNAEWRYVPTRSNPADLNSRGLEAMEFLQSELWRFGPIWLKQTEDEWPKVPASVETEEGKRIAHAHVAVPRAEWKFLFRFQSWPKLLRVTAYCLRFNRRICKERRSFVKDIIEPSEMQLAMERIASYIQKTHFAEEYRCLNDHREIPTKSPLKNLTPFLDAKGVMRVGGRLENAVLTWETKHPIILPKHYVSILIIRQCHVDTLHGGLQSTIHTVRQQFWILGCRNAARSVINRCMKCIRWKGKTSTQIMQDLIAERSRPARAFSNCGVDYAGPFRVRDSAGRGKTAHKAYIAVFVCYATRAIHIELVHDYSTSSFLAALDRFSARRGIPSCIFSDNGTNFVGADRELQIRIREAMSSSEMRNNCSIKGIRWRFNPPSAPHFGGMQEAGVKSVKFHLKRIIGEFTPTGEEMQTLLCKIEASLNSRPIAPLSDSPDDYAALTPGHFLTGGPLNAIPDTSVESENLARLSRWRVIQKFHEQLWKHWTRDYLAHLQSRYKWKTTHAQLKPGDLVLVQNPLLPPNQWEMGRVEEVFPGKDENVRVVKVRTPTST